MPRPCAFEWGIICTPGTRITYPNLWKSSKIVIFFRIFVIFGQPMGLAGWKWSHSKEQAVGFRMRYNLCPWDPSKAQKVCHKMLGNPGCHNYDLKTFFRAGGSMGSQKIPKNITNALEMFLERFISGLGRYEHLKSQYKILNCKPFWVYVKLDP